jgi:ribosome-binding protein aMBF1 (putative translation factor)
MWKQNISYSSLLCRMAKTSKTENLNISKIEQYVIDRVREMRIEKGMSQRELADLLDMSNGFIAKVESPKMRAKYNLNHINAIAKIFKCALTDILPNKPM